MGKGIKSIIKILKYYFFLFSSIFNFLICYICLSVIHLSFRLRATGLSVFTVMCYPRKLKLLLTYLACYYKNFRLI